MLCATDSLKETDWLKYVDIETLSDKDTALLIDCWVDVLIEIDCVCCLIWGIVTEN